MPAWYMVLFLYNFRLTIGVIMALRILACVFMFNVDNLDQPLHYLITIYGWKRVWKPARFQDEIFNLHFLLIFVKIILTIEYFLPA